MFIQNTIADAIGDSNSNHQFTICYPGDTILDMDKGEFRVQKLKRLVEDEGGPAEFARKRSRNDADKPIDATYISQILNGHRAFGEKAAANMVRRAGLTSGYFDQGDDDDSALPAGAHHFNSPHEVPVVGTTQGGPPDNLWLELEYSVGYSDQYLEAATPDPHAYALRVVGNSMAPRMMEGDWLMVEPASEAQPGMEVVVRTAEGAVMVKRFSSRHSDTIILESTNEAFSRITLMAHEVEFIHPVGGIFPPWKIKQRIGEQFAGAGRRATQQPVNEERRRADQVPDNSDRNEFVPPIPRPMTIDEPRTTTKKEAKK